VRAKCLLLVPVLLCAASAAVCAADNKVVAPAPADSLRAAVPPVFNFDVIARENYLRRHVFSLDNFLEFQPNGMVTRLGPIGNEAAYSRWGIGRGRALVVVDGIPMNDPQDGVAPLVHIATSGLASLTLDAPDRLSFAPGIEGSVSMHDLVAPPNRPNTFIELTKATNELRQRRVRFGSEAGRVGLDISYDEVLDEGYDFDANDVVPVTPPEGAANSRAAAVAVRGEMDDHTRYTAGIRRFRSSTTGDLQSALTESSRSGHLAWASVGMGTTEAVVYGRGYNTTRADSSTSNESVGGTVAWNLQRRGATLHMFALGEHTNATQDIGGADARNRVSHGNAGASTEVVQGGFTWFGHAVMGGDENALAWGAGAGVRRDVPRGEVALSGQRSYRLPSIAERYLPAHARDGFMLSGDAGVDPETALEANADWTLRGGGITNRVRASWMRSRDYISFAAVEGDSVARRAANASDQPSMTFVEERFDLATNIGALEVLADAGARLGTGDRTGLFLSVPKTQVNASLTCGMQLFEKSSALYLGAEYAYVDDRYDYNGVLLPSYNVVNVSLMGRLVDARFYVRWLNLLDEQYQTVSGYLMTPRTLAYGIEWTLFN
jgi:hypothetical protein